MPSFRRTADVALAGLALVGAAACNSLVGIEMPTDRQTDAALQSGPRSTTTGSLAIDAATDRRAGDNDDVNAQSPPEGDGALGAGGSGAQSPPPQTSDAGGRSDGGARADAGTPCPSIMPVPHAPCREIGLECQYNDDPRGDRCRDTATCSPTGWLTTIQMCGPLLSATCPATRAEARDAACSPRLAWCMYDDGLSCQCTNCPPGFPTADCGGPVTWHCQEPSKIYGCPATLPNAGTACDPNGVSCAYQCGSSGTRVCRDGIWVRGDSVKCPQIPPAD